MIYNWNIAVPEESEIAENLTVVNTSLADWINHERFPLFTKITHGNLHQLWKVRSMMQFKKNDYNVYRL